MKAKISRGSGFRGVLNYVLDKGEAEIVGGNLPMLAWRKYSPRCIRTDARVLSSQANSAELSRTLTVCERSSAKAKGFGPRLSFGRFGCSVSGIWY